MKIAVLIKQVPATTNVLVDPVTGVLIRDNKNNKMNPYDLYAIETAMQIKSKAETETQITAITMGPPQAKSVLQEALWMGCEEAVLLSDRKFAGADVLSTTHTLSEGILSLGGFDIIVCGKQTTDGDTAQVGPEIAEFLQIPQATYVQEIISVSSRDVTLTCHHEAVDEKVRITFPCLITVEKDIYTPRLPSYKRGNDLKNKEIRVFSLADLTNQDEQLYGLNGSPTQVERIFSPEVNNKKVLVEGTNQELSELLYKNLKEDKFF